MRKHYHYERKSNGLLLELITFLIGMPLAISGFFLPPIVVALIGRVDYPWHVSIINVTAQLPEVLLWSVGGVSFVVLFVGFLRAPAIIGKAILQQYCQDEIQLRYVWNSKALLWSPYVPTYTLTRGQLLSVHILSHVFAAVALLALPALFTVSGAGVAMLPSFYVMAGLGRKIAIVPWVLTHPRGTRYRERTPGVITAIPPS